MNHVLKTMIRKIKLIPINHLIEISPTTEADIGIGDQIEIIAENDQKVWIIAEGITTGLHTTHGGQDKTTPTNPDKTGGANGVEASQGIEPPADGHRPVDTDTAVQSGLEAFQPEDCTQICVRETIVLTITTPYLKNFVANVTRIRTTHSIVLNLSCTATNCVRTVNKDITQQRNADKKTDFSINHRQTNISLSRHYIHWGL